MISLSGIICRELKKQDKLPEKYEDLAMEPMTPSWMNTIYKGADLYTGSHLEYGDYNTASYGLLAPTGTNCPVDLMAHPWALEANVFVPRTAYTDSTGTTEQLFLAVFDSSHKRVFQLKHQVNTIRAGFDSNPSSSETSVSTGSYGLWRLKIEYTPTSETTGTIKTYHGLNRGDSYSLAKTFAYNAATHGEMKQLEIRHLMHDADVAVSGIKFTYNDEVLFQKEGSSRFKLLYTETDSEFTGTSLPMNTQGWSYDLVDSELKYPVLDWSKNWILVYSLGIATVRTNSYVNAFFRPVKDQYLSVATGSWNKNIMGLFSPDSSTNNQIYSKSVSANSVQQHVLMYEAQTKKIHFRYRATESSSWVNPGSTSLASYVPTDGEASRLSFMTCYPGATIDVDNIYFAYNGEVLF